MSEASKLIWRNLNLHSIVNTKYFSNNLPIGNKLEIRQ